MSTWFTNLGARLKSSDVRLPSREDEEDAMELLPDGGTPRATTSRGRRYSWPLAALAGVGLLAVFVTLVASNRGSAEPSAVLEDAIYTTNATGNHEIDALFARQPRTLREAKARYTLKTGRPPPFHYDRWFKKAKEDGCLIDEYDQIYRDFQPFYELAENDPLFFSRMVDKASAKVKKRGKGMKTIEIYNGYAKQTDGQGTLYSEEWPKMMNRFAKDLPNMKTILNGRDEPRVAFNYREAGAHEQALKLLDDSPGPFDQRPSPTSTWFKSEHKCLVPNQPDGFTILANDVNAFLLFSASTEFTTAMYPMLSMTKISPCFSDILVPSQFYYSDSSWYPRYGRPDDMSWSNKKSQLYWRGATSGGWFSGDNYRSFPRFRLIDIARNHSDILDVRLTRFSDGNCGDNCDADKIKQEYSINGQGAPREEVYGYKYVFDVDGNSFSGRYHGLLKSGTLVFKSTIFEEYFNDWLLPFVHYIPVLPDLSDLVEKVEWAIAHDDEAHRIQEMGKLFTETVFTDKQNDCYWFLVLLEYGRLYRHAEGVAGKKGWWKRETST